VEGGIFMIQLFDIVSPGFFNILTGPTKFMYADIVYLLFQKSHEESSYTFSKEDFVNIIDDYFKKHQNIELISETEELKTTRDKATYTYRKLKECGWIDEDVGADQEILVNFEDYAIAFLNTYSNFNTTSSFELSSKVYGIYQILNSFDVYQGYLTLHTIVEQSKDLINKLRSLNSNIKKYIKKIVKLDQKDDMAVLNSILTQLLGEYKEKVIDKAYYYMKTNDNPLKYRRVFEQKCKEIKNDQNQSNIIINQIMESDEIDYLTACQRYDEIMDYIETVFDTVIFLMSEIDRKNSKYINVAIEKIKIIMNHDTDIEGYLLHILKNYSVLTKDDLTFHFTSSKQINKNSLYTARTIKKFEKSQLLEESTVINSEKVEKDIEKIMRFSKPNIWKYVDKKLIKKKVLTIDDFDVGDEEEYIKFLLILIYQNEADSKYQVKWKEQEVSHQGFLMKDFIIERKN